MGLHGPKATCCQPDEKYGRLTILKEAEPAAGPGKTLRQVLCRCECGREKIIRVASLRGGLTKSCGCLHDTHRLRHGHAGGGTLSLTYSSWKSLRTRCLNPKAAGYHRYGGRGITVCARWLGSFEAFLADMGERPSRRHSIERQESDGHYEPGNCYWGTPKEQARNRSNNRMLTFNGETLSCAEWADRIGIKRNALQARLNQRGYTVEEALTLPPGAKRNG